jgi:hypothetical protein
MTFKEVYDCEMLIFKIDRCPALYNCSLKEYSNMHLKDRLWGEVCKAVIYECSQLDSPEKHEKVSRVVFNIINTNARVYINLL